MVVKENSTRVGNSVSKAVQKFFLSRSALKQDGTQAKGFEGLRGSSDDAFAIALLAFGFCFLCSFPIAYIGGLILKLIDK
jgi:hypothetical protein